MTETSSKAKNLKKVNIEGFEFELDPEVVDDLKFFEYLQEIEDGRPTSYVRVIKLLLGKDYDGLMNHLTEIHGKVTLGKSQEIFESITKQINPKS